MMDAKQILDNIPAGLIYAFGKVNYSFFKFNTTWGFILSKEEYEEHKEALAPYTTYLKDQIKIDDGSILGFTFNPSLIRKVAVTVLGDAISEDKLNSMVEEGKKAIDADKVKFVKLIESVIKTPEKYNVRKDGVVSLDIALYSLNQSNTLVDDETTFNAYKLSYSDMIDAFKSVKGLKPSMLRISDGTRSASVQDSNCMQLAHAVVRNTKLDDSVDDAYVAGVTFKLLIKVR